MRRFFRTRPVVALAFMILVAGCATPTASRRSQQPVYQPIVSQPVPVQNLVPSRTWTPDAKDPFTGFTYHTILPKQTLWRISKMYDVPVKVIMDANSLRDATKITAGDILIIPGATKGVSTFYPEIPLLGSKSKWKYIVIHHTATFEGDAGSIDKMHKKRGWKYGMGYHFLIDNGTLGHKDGEIEIGKRWLRQMKGAHANKANMNHIGIGISLVGNFSKESVSKAQLDALAYLVNTLKRYYQIPNHKVIRHKDVPGAATECPGNHFPWSDLKSRLH